MSLVCCLSALVFGITSVGCGFERLDGALPAAVAGFSLSDLEDIQDDERLTDDEKRDRIREAVGAPDNDSGDRLVEFLLTFNVP
jgi:hypothetical protein